MFIKENRLTKDKDFNEVFKKGRSSYDKIVGVKTIANNLEIIRFGIIIGKKVSKKAVERNRIKRIIREFIKKELEKLKIGKDVLIIVLPGLVDMKGKELESSIANHFRKLKIYK